MGKPVRDLTGMRFGKLNVIRAAGGDRHGNMTWLCACDCGTQKTIARGELTRGKTKSCGCSSGKKPISGYGIRRGTKLYETWKNMNGRCHNPRNKAYQNYGERGIYVCDEWRDDFLAFARDMGEPPTPQHSIDRIDNDGPYAPGNCRWADKHIQNANQRHEWRAGEGNPNSRLTADSVRMIRASDLSHSALGRAFGVSHNTIRAIRLRKIWKDVE